VKSFSGESNPLWSPYRWTCTARTYTFPGPGGGPIFDDRHGTYTEHDHLRAAFGDLCYLCN